MPESTRTILGLHRWCHKTMQRFAYVVLAAMQGDADALGRYGQGVVRLQGALRERMAALLDRNDANRQDLEALLAQTEQLQRMIACVPWCLGGGASPT